MMGFNYMCVKIKASSKKRSEWQFTLLMTQVPQITAVWNTDFKKGGGNLLAAATLTDVMVVVTGSSFEGESL